jgi:hypothetical protein
MFGFPVLNTYREGIPLATNVPFPPCAAAPRGQAVRGGPNCARRVSHRVRPLGAFGLTTHGVMLGPSDTENHVGTRPSASEHHKQAFYASCERLSSRSLAVLSWLGSSRADVDEECYLVDPASSHMLVSKIKPCMCKYELIQTVKLRMAH